MFPSSNVSQPSNSPGLSNREAAWLPSLQIQHCLIPTSTTQDLVAGTVEGVVSMETITHYS